MNTRTSTTESRRDRWLRMALLGYTVASPTVRVWLERMRQRGENGRGQEKVQDQDANAPQAKVFERLDDLAAESRQWMTGQVERLRTQAKEMEVQSRKLRKTLRSEARERRKLLAQMRKSGRQWSQDMLRRGEDLAAAGTAFAEEQLKAGQKLVHPYVERSSDIAQDLLERGEKASQQLVQQSEKVAQELAKRGSKVTHDLAERGEHLLEPMRKRDRNFWSIVGFCVGLLAAGGITYWLIRRRVGQVEIEEESPIELPHDTFDGRGSQSRPAGEIHHIDQNGAVDTVGTAVAARPAIGVVSAERPASAAFVGVVSTKRYYPVDQDAELGSKDLIYFTTEEEAKARGYSISSPE